MLLTFIYEYPIYVNMILELFILIGIVGAIGIAFFSIMGT